MKIKNFSLVLAIVAMSVSSASAQNFFWSLSDIGGGAANSDLTIDTNASPSGTVFLYYADNGQAITEGLDLDFTWTNNDVVEFTAAETFEADITFGPGGPPINDRWGDNFGPASDVQANSVSGFTTVNVVNGTGIQPEHAPGVLNDDGFDLVDTLYDTSNNSFLIGSINYNTLTDAETSILVSGLVVDGGADIGASFSGLTFAGAAIPEPSTAGLLALGLVGLVSRRRR